MVLLPILASTAGGLWLTTSTLIRALYAMARENLVPPGFGRLNCRQVPHLVIVSTLDAALAVVAAQLLASGRAFVWATRGRSSAPYIFEATSVS